MSNKKIIVIYHGGGCLDGFGSAYIAWKQFGNDAEYIPAQYGNSPPDVKDKEVYIVDFSYPRDALLKMADEASFIQVLDHHKTAQKDLEGLVCAKFDMNKSGIGMTWEYFNKDKKLPYSLAMIQDRDLWMFEIPDTKPFTLALKSFIKETFIAWDGIVEYPKEQIYLIERGKDLIHVFNKDVEELVNKSHAMELSKACCMIVACNAMPKYASELGNVLAKKHGLMAAIYFYDGSRKEWQFSLRSVGGFDVSAIAQVYGGGGHSNAAGFSVKSFGDL